MCGPDRGASSTVPSGFSPRAGPRLEEISRAGTATRTGAERRGPGAGVGAGVVSAQPRGGSEVTGLALG